MDGVVLSAEALLALSAEDEGVTITQW